jgi:hypothetical protein
MGSFVFDVSVTGQGLVEGFLNTERTFGLIT